MPYKDPYNVNRGQGFFSNRGIVQGGQKELSANISQKIFIGAERMIQ